jgi:hypothetical protein
MKITGNRFLLKLLINNRLHFLSPVKCRKLQEKHPTKSMQKRPKIEAIKVVLFFIPIAIGTKIILEKVVY